MPGTERNGNAPGSNIIPKHPQQMTDYAPLYKRLKDLYHLIERTRRGCAINRLSKAVGRNPETVGDWLLYRNAPRKSEPYFIEQAFNTINDELEAQFKEARSRIAAFEVTRDYLQNEITKLKQ